MMTRTLSSDLVKSQIYCTSVDTGWVTRMNPRQFNVRSDTPPLTCEDGAARVLDPILSSFLTTTTTTTTTAPLSSSSSTSATNTPLYGVFLQNFAVSKW